MHAEIGGPLCRVSSHLSPLYGSRNETQFTVRQSSSVCIRDFSPASSAWGNSKHYRIRRPHFHFCIWSCEFCCWPQALLGFVTTSHGLSYLGHLQEGFVEFGCHWQHMKLIYLRPTVETKHLPKHIELPSGQISGQWWGSVMAMCIPRTLCRGKVSWGCVACTFVILCKKTG